MPGVLPDLYIFLNPDGTQQLGLVAIVAARTGVRYTHQCGGLNIELRELEGFAVPLGDAEAARPFREFFWKRFRSNPPAFNQSQDARLAEGWTPELLDELGALVARVAVWRTYPDAAGTDDQREMLQLDRTRLSELTEGWIPVSTAYGSGALIFANSD